MVMKDNKPSMATTSVTSDSTLHNPSINDPCSKNDANSCKMYKGVRKRKWGKWVSEIRLPNSRERIWLGSYDTQEKAARAFDAALYCLRGSHANFNFPETPLNLEINNAHSLSHHEIQEVAQKFANNDITTTQIESENNQEEEEEEEEEASMEEESQNCANSSSLGLFESNNQRESSNSSLSHVCDYDDGTMQVDHGDMMRTMDWTFLNMLDDHDSSYDSIGAAACYDFGLYYGIDKVHPSGELLYSTPPPTTLFEDNFNNGEEIDHQGDDDAFSNHSFLWSWNF